VGVVQGVGFRPFVYRIAVRNGLRGYVRNLGDSGVEIVLEGDGGRVKAFMEALEAEKPPLAQIHRLEASPLEGKEIYSSFSIRGSSDEAEASGSVIPPDVSICDECLRELRDPEDPRHNYFFITCTNCGPRYTIIERVPYDRENTTMREFEMCSLCRGEYRDPLNRRFHTQTVACPSCGPRVYLATKVGEVVDDCDPIREAGRLLSEGYILAVKGYGGFHVAAAATMDEPIARLRRAKHRAEKPFAVMARSLEAVRMFAEVGSKEAELLASHARPIVLLRKSEGYCLSELVAPGLHNVGVMLPYTGLHYMLFDGFEGPALVMTSANLPNQPIVKEDSEALERLGEVVDYFLLHNRRIAHRCDDSVLRVHGGRQVFIRRSRGYAPAPVILRVEAGRCVLGLGGELNNTACILLRGKAFLSQHIGDVDNVETRGFLEDAVNHLIRLTNSRVEAVACDLHPSFSTTRLARELSEEKGLPLIQVQHHHAHIASLMAEHGVDEVVGVCCDGYGYGIGGEAWGGEVLLCTREPSSFRRLAHLEKQPLAGGDLATQYPLRMAAGVLYGAGIDVEGWLLESGQRFPHGEAEAKVLLHQLRGGRGLTWTTSCGRVLDAAAAILGICYKRTYEGEPAMKLESAAISGRDALELKPVIKGDVLETTGMMREVFENRGRLPRGDLAYSVHSYLARGLAEIAVEEALNNGVKAVGFSGGCACNQILTSVMRGIVEEAGLRFLVNEAAPPGDGGLSLGQAFVAAFLASHP
jgi:hydrogenase maturation protein HypF